MELAQSCSGGPFFGFSMHFFHGCLDFFLLRHLDLANNELHYLPDSMAQMTELGSLDETKLVSIFPQISTGVSEPGNFLLREIWLYEHFVNTWK